jgi:KR domain
MSIQNGARHIVLTSRRGMRFIEENDFEPTKQKFKYLKNLKDLDLRVEAADAASFEATGAVVKSIDQPIGGCLLMTLVLSDGLFMRHTEETYRKVFDAKVKAVQALNAAIPIEMLDFFVFFSSITTILGNNGQGNYTS